MGISYLGLSCLQNSKHPLVDCGAFYVVDDDDFDRTLRSFQLDAELLGEGSAQGGMNGRRRRRFPNRLSNSGSKDSGARCFAEMS